MPTLPFLTTLLNLVTFGFFAPCVLFTVLAYRRVFRLSEEAQLVKWPGEAKLSGWLFHHGEKRTRALLGIGPPSDAALSRALRRYYLGWRTGRVLGGLQFVLLVLVFIGQAR